MAKVEAAWREPSRSRKLARGSGPQPPSSQIAPIAILLRLELIKETLDPEETKISARMYEYQSPARHFFAFRNSHPS
jgi:hypothetical protein